MAGATEASAAFRAKAAFMKTWKPASAPSNRDKLELYALHKQSVTGDASATLPTNASGPEKAKFQAWRSKSGIPREEAMRRYIQESDRQVCVYGTARDIETVNSNPQTPQTTPSDAVNGGPEVSPASPRGLAAIPLLCAAASESRPAYLRRLSQTPLEAAWWGRQEALCAPPGTIGAMPETLVIYLARFVEYISLKPSEDPSQSLVRPAVIQALLWPVHNSLLSLWMGVILVATAASAAWAVVQTLIWGERRTGMSLPSVWADCIQVASDSIGTMCASHQALSCRLIGLILLPYCAIVGVVTHVFGGGSNPGTASNSNVWLAVESVTFVAGMATLWWYWAFVLPWLASCLLGTALMTGICFALIELAGV